MKKFFCFSVCMLVALANAFADDGSYMETYMLHQSLNAIATEKAAEVKECGMSQIKLSGFNQYPSDNEFLFDSKAAYDSAPKNNGTHTVKGKVFECDNEYCSHGMRIDLGPGHVFKGKVVDEYRTYFCDTSSSDDHWEYEVTEMVCGETHISYDGIQRPNDNEFLYSSKAAYDSARNRPDGGTIAGGLVYECDDKHCTHNAIQDVPAGHVFKGDVIKEAAKYRCVVETSGDYWERIYEGCEYMGKKISIGSWYVDDVGQKISLSYGQCSQFHDMNPADINKRFNAKCESVNGENMMVCYPVGGSVTPPADQCPKGTSDKVLSQANCGANEEFECRVSDVKTRGCKCGLCKPKSVTPPENQCPKGSSDKILSQKNCRSDQTFKCEKPGDGGKCICGACYNKDNGGGGSTLACPEGSSSQITSPDKCKKAEDFVCDKWKGSVCQCGACKEPGQPVIEPDKPWDCNTMTSQMASLLQWQAECVGEATIMNQINNIMTMCTNGTMTQATFETMYNSLVLLKPEQCEDRVAAALIARKKKEISEAVSRIDGLVDGLKTSVWKDEEGKFNTARLASDSIAGVVLGTTGALVTSNVVKKNQVKGGFEDIQCVIGGQTVAGWGDEFRVGIQ